MVLSQKPAQSMEKLRLSSKKTVKRSIVNYTKMLFRTKGMTCLALIEIWRFFIIIVAMRVCVCYPLSGNR